MNALSLNFIIDSPFISESLPLYVLYGDYHSNYVFSIFCHPIIICCRTTIICSHFYHLWICIYSHFLPLIQVLWLVSSKSSNVLCNHHHAIICLNSCLKMDLDHLQESRVYKYPLIHFQPCHNPQSLGGVNWHCHISKSLFTETLRNHLFHDGNLLGIDSISSKHVPILESSYIVIFCWKREPYVHLQVHHQLLIVWMHFACYPLIFHCCLITLNRFIIGCRNEWPDLIHCLVMIHQSFSR